MISRVTMELPSKHTQCNLRDVQVIKLKEKQKQGKRQEQYGFEHLLAAALLPDMVPHTKI
jgi:hypothetical protein